jgi:hypothetical protein
MAEEQVKKKSWFRRHWLLTSILAIVIIIIIAAAASNSNNSGSSGGLKVVNNYPCPELSGIELLGYSSLMQAWTAKEANYNSGNVQVSYGYSTGNVIYCDVGTEEGQNANYVYCGDFARPIIAEYTDNSGKIIKKRSIEVTFDKNTKQYIETKCDTYDLMD